MLVRPVQQKIKLSLPYSFLKIFLKKKKKKKKKKKTGTNSCVRSEAALGQKNNTSIPALVILEKISYLG